VALNGLAAGAGPKEQNAEGRLRSHSRNKLNSVGGDSKIASSIIVSNPAILSGEPVFRGTRVPFKSLTDYLEHGRTLDEFLEDFPGVSRSDAIAAIEEARTSLAAALK
jgi:uncharacterized protein (DUF433 family)